MVDNNKLAVFAGYYTRSLFPLSAFLNGIEGIHPGLINLNEIKTRVLEFFLACIERDSLCYNTFVSSQELSCRHKPISNSKLTDSSASSGSPLSREITDPQPGLNSEYLESATVSSQCRLVLCRIAALSNVLYMALSSPPSGITIYLFQTSPSDMSNSSSYNTRGFSCHFQFRSQKGFFLIFRKRPDTE